MQDLTMTAGRCHVLLWSARQISVLSTIRVKRWEIEGYFNAAPDFPRFFRFLLKNSLKFSVFSFSGSTNWSDHDGNNSNLPWSPARSNCRHQKTRFISECSVVDVNEWTWSWLLVAHAESNAENRNKQRFQFVESFNARRTDTEQHK